MIRCSKCGTINKADETFCTECNAYLEWNGERDRGRDAHGGATRATWTASLRRAPARPTPYVPPIHSPAPPPPAPPSPRGPAPPGQPGAVGGSTAPTWTPPPAPPAGPSRDAPSPLPPAGARRCRRRRPRSRQTRPRPAATSTSPPARKPTAAPAEPRARKPEKGSATPAPKAKAAGRSQGRHDQARRPHLPELREWQRPTRKFCRRCGNSLLEAVVEPRPGTRARALAPTALRPTSARNVETYAAGARPASMAGASRPRRRFRLPNLRGAVIGVMVLLGLGAFASYLYVPDVTNMADDVMRIVRDRLLAARPAVPVAFEGRLRPGPRRPRRPSTATTPQRSGSALATLLSRTPTGPLPGRRAPAPASRSWAAPPTTITRSTGDRAPSLCGPPRAASSFRSSTRPTSRPSTSTLAVPEASPCASSCSTRTLAEAATAWPSQPRLRRLGLKFRPPVRRGCADRHRARSGPQRGRRTPRAPR